MMPDFGQFRNSCWDPAPGQMWLQCQKWLCKCSGTSQLKHNNKSILKIGLL
jgi:hypothetical protein